MNILASKPLMPKCLASVNGDLHQLTLWLQIASSLLWELKVTMQAFNLRHTTLQFRS